MKVYESSHCRYPLGIERAELRCHPDGRMSIWWERVESGAVVSTGEVWRPSPAIAHHEWVRIRRCHAGFREPAPLQPELFG